MKPVKGNLFGLPGALLLGGSLRILFFFVADNNGGDAVARAANIQKWMSEPSFSGPVAHWGPVYFYLAGALGFLLKNPELAGRLLSMISGVASIYLVHRLARVLGGETSATLSAFICALSGLPIGYSTTSSAEMLYLFFLLLGLVGFFENRASGHVAPLIWGAISFSMSTGIRYEAWIFFPFLCMFLVWPFFRAPHQSSWSTRRWIELAVFTLVGGAWITLWLVYSWLHWGDALHAIHLNQALILHQSPESLRPLPYRLSLPVGVLLLSLSPLPFGGALYAIVKNRKPSLARQFVFLSLGFAVVQYVEFWRGAAISNARYTLTLFTLGVVLSGLGIAAFCTNLSLASASRSRKWVLATLILTQLLILAGSESRIPSSEKLASVSARLRYPHYLNDAAKSLATRLGPADYIILDSYNLEDNIFAHALGLPLDSRGRLLVGWEASPTILEEFVRTHHPRFLVFSDQGILKRYLNLPAECAEDLRIGDIRLNCFYYNTRYRVYQIEYSDPGLKATLMPTSVTTRGGHVHPKTKRVHDPYACKSPLILPIRSCMASLTVKMTALSIPVS